MKTIKLLLPVAIMAIFMNSCVNIIDSHTSIFHKENINSTTNITGKIISLEENNKLMKNVKVAVVKGWFYDESAIIDKSVTNESGEFDFSISSDDDYCYYIIVEVPEFYIGEGENYSKDNVYRYKLKVGIENTVKIGLNRAGIITFDLIKSDLNSDSWVKLLESPYSFFFHYESETFMRTYKAGQSYYFKTESGDINNPTVNIEEVEVIAGENTTLNIEF